jgi:cysteinyl-tRNA synthetase
VHVAPMRLDGDKMSKSKGNMIFVRDALRETHPDGLRLYLLGEHYRRPFDHNARRMAKADALAAAIHRLADHLGSRECSSAIIPRAALRILDRDLTHPQCSICSPGSRGPAIRARWRWLVTWAVARSRPRSRNRRAPPPLP